MKFDRLAPYGIAAAVLAWLCACDPHPKPPPPKAQQPDLAARTSFSAAGPGLELMPPEVPISQRHRENVRGVGIRPSGSASGISP